MKICPLEPVIKSPKHALNSPQRVIYESKLNQKQSNFNLNLNSITHTTTTTTINPNSISSTTKKGKIQNGENKSPYTLNFSLANLLAISISRVHHFASLRRLHISDLPFFNLPPTDLGFVHSDETRKKTKDLILWSLSHKII